MHKMSLDKDMTMISILNKNVLEPLVQNLPLWGLIKLAGTCKYVRKYIINCHRWKNILKLPIPAFIKNSSGMMLFNNHKTIVLGMNREFYIIKECDKEILENIMVYTIGTVGVNPPRKMYTRNYNCEPKYIFGQYLK